MPMSSQRVGGEGAEQTFPGWAVARPSRTGGCRRRRRDWERRGRNFKVSRFQGFTVSRFARVSKFQTFKGFNNFEGSKFNVFAPTNFNVEKYLKGNRETSKPCKKP